MGYFIEGYNMEESRRASYHAKYFALLLVQHDRGWDHSTGKHCVIMHCLIVHETSLVSYASTRVDDIIVPKPLQSAIFILVDGKSVIFSKKSVCFFLNSFRVIQK